MPLAEQRGIPHHLVDLVEPQEVFTAGEYRRRAVDALEDVRRREKLPILAAGTGLYLRALLVGDSPMRPPDPKNSVRGFVQKFRRAARSICTGCSTAWDREAASRIAARDTQKIIRAIEIRILAGKAVGEIHRGGRSGLKGYAVKAKIGLSPPRDRLYAKIDARVNAMIAAGWVDEVRRLVEMGRAHRCKAVSVHRLLGFARCRFPIAAHPLK